MDDRGHGHIDRRKLVASGLAHTPTHDTIYIPDQQSIQRLLTACSWRVNFNQKKNKTNSYLRFPDIPLDMSTNLAVKASQVICAKHSSNIIGLPVMHWNCRLASNIAA